MLLAINPDIASEMQEEDHRKLLAAGCAAVFEPASLYHSGIGTAQHLFIMLQQCCIQVTAPYMHV